MRLQGKHELCFGRFCGTREQKKPTGCNPWACGQSFRFRFYDSNSLTAVPLSINLIGRPSELMFSLRGLILSVW